MDSVLMALYIAVLFFVLAPGILLTLPRGGNKTTVAMTHALVAAVVFYFTHTMAHKFVRRFEGFQDMMDTNKKVVNTERAAPSAKKVPSYKMGG